MLFTVHRGRERTTIGFIVESKRDCEAYDHRGISLGRFPDKDAATEAVYEQARIADFLNR